jgi:putative tricarboxylic transport membrane protein
MEHRDRISSLIFLVFSVLTCVGSYRLPVGIGSWHDPGPGFFPFWAGVIMGILSFAAYWRALRTKGEDIGPWYSREKWKKVLLIMAIISAYALVLETLGFVFSTFLLLFTLFKLTENQGWRLSVGGSLVVAAVSFVVFDRWLKLQLPKGFWGF